MLLVPLQQSIMVAGKAATELFPQHTAVLRRHATSLDGNTSNYKSRLIKQSIGTWEIILVNSPDELSPNDGYGLTGSNLLTSLPSNALTSVIVDTPIISLSTLELSVTAIKENLIVLIESNATVILKASLTTPGSNGAVVWEVQIKLTVQIQPSGSPFLSATGFVHHVSGSKKGPPIPLEQYNSLGQNELSIAGAGNIDDLPSNCINGTQASDCRTGASLLTFVGTYSTTFQLVAIFAHVVPHLSPPPPPPKPLPALVANSPTPVPTSMTASKSSMMCSTRGEVCKKGKDCCSKKCKKSRCK